MPEVRWVEQSVELLVTPNASTPQHLLAASQPVWPPATCTHSVTPVLFAIWKTIVLETGVEIFFTLTLAKGREKEISAA
jgi:hypothetical protein